MYFINPRIKHLHRIFDQNERKDYLRLDLNENPGGLPQDFISEVLSDVTPQFVSQYPETLEFTASSEGNVILHTTQDIPDYVFLRLSAKNMYISNMEVYDGYFTAAELGIDVINEAANTRNAAPRKISTIVTTYTTTENSYTFNDLKSGYRYDISIRSVVADDYVSPWSNPYRVDIVTAINAISVNKSASSSCAWYTINGQRLNGAPTRPGIYIRNGQKIIK